jgi:hypothetical protein
MNEGKEKNGGCVDVNPTKVHFKALISMWQIFKYSLMNEIKKN